MTPWPHRAIGDVVDRADGLVQTGPFGSQLHRSDYTEGEGVPLVMPKDLVAGRINYSSTARVNREKATEMRRHACEPRDVLLARRGDIGRCALVRASDTGVLCGTGCIRVSVQGSDLLPEFLFYFLSSQRGREELEARAVGATMANLSAGAVRLVSVPVPSRETQRKIASVLSAYDDLIENNRRRIEVLDEMAQRIYHEWFVDLRYPGREEAPLAQSELGPIPRGWCVRRVEELAECDRGLSWDREQEAEEGPVRVITIPNVQRRLVRSGFTHLDGVPPKQVERYVLREGDIVLVGSNGNPDRVGDAVRMPALSNLLFASFLMRVRPMDTCSSPSLLYAQLRDRRVRSAWQSSAIGATSLRNLRITTLRDTRVAWPTDRVASEAERVLTPIFRTQDQLDRQSDSLREARDLILLRIITGVVDVGDLEIDVEETAA